MTLPNNDKKILREDALIPKSLEKGKDVVPTSPLWQMGKVVLGSKESFDLLQNTIDRLASKSKSNKPFNDNEKEFMREVFEALWWGGNIKGFPEAAKLADHYVNGNGISLEIDAEVYKSSIIVNDSMQAMKKYIKDCFNMKKSIATLITSDGNFFTSIYAVSLKSGVRNIDTQGYINDKGLLFAEQSNSRLKNTNNRFYLQVDLTKTDESFIATWKVEDNYDFEPFSKGYISDIHLNKDFVLKLPDGLSHYLTKIGVAKDFKYFAKWQEIWR